jgi:hypothetical protein
MTTEMSFTPKTSTEEDQGNHIPADPLDITWGKRAFNVQK